jgi:putative transposase
MNSSPTIGFRRRHLPHWTVAGHSYFVTIRLKGSLPRSVTATLVQEREDLAARRCSGSEMEQLQRDHFRRIETILDAARSGSKFLNVASVADVVLRAVTWLEDNKGWFVDAATIMPNHTHMLMRHPDGRNAQLNHDLGLFKGFTAREANKILGRVGKPFWMDENFDHWCRDEAKVRGVVAYIVRNPVKAGLVPQWRDWPWTRVNTALLPDSAE